jgi:hypothetical protein
MDTSAPQLVAKRKEEPAGMEIPEAMVTKLEGHLSEVFVCAWNPKYPSLLASG